MTIAVLGLILVQVYWSIKTITTEEIRFDAKVNEAMINIVSKIDKDKTVDILVEKISVDDFITKPFSMEELLFRISAILKRVNRNSKRILIKDVIVGKYKYNYTKRILAFENKTIKLTSKENQLLHLLVI